LPAVRGLQRQLEPGGIDTLLVDIHSEDGMILRERLGFELSPTFIVFDAGGDEVWRANVIPSRVGVLGALDGRLE
jgi:hypothetical protein